MIKIKVSYTAADRLLYDDIMNWIGRYIVKKKGPQKSAGSPYNRMYLVLKMPPTNGEISDESGQNA